MLITGASGLLGSHLIPQAVREYDVYGISHLNDSTLPTDHSLRLDLTDLALTRKFLNHVKPKLILHCAALTDVDRCEAAPEAAQLLNSDVPGALAEWAEQNGSTLTFISTDSVFDGARGAYEEEDSANPLNQYARTKLAGEIAVRSVNPTALILRTNFYGWSPNRKPSLAEWILNTLTRGDQLQAFTDVRFNPLLVNDLADIILRLIRRKTAGVFHVGATNSCSKYDFAMQVANLFSLDTIKIIPVSVDSFPFKAKRPKDTVLDVRKIAKYLGEEMPTLESGLLRFKQLFDDGYVPAMKRGHLPQLETANLH